MKTEPFVTILVPVRKINPFLLELVSHLKHLSYSNYEVIIIPDSLGNQIPSWPKCRFYASGLVGPAEKRDLAIRYAKGEILAFIDDDAYPSPGWLKQAVLHFSDQQVVAVGGPGVTPTAAPVLEQASGWISASPLGSGPYTYRFIPRKTRFVDDYPSMNLLIKKEDFIRVGGFDSQYYPGEDTKLCLDLVANGKKIIYEPKALVYHHRRPLWKPHLKQNGQFGIHRGHFARILPKTSFRLSYLMPSILLSSLIALCFALVFDLTLLGRLIATGLVSYCILLLLNSVWIAIKSRKITLAVISIPAIVVTHLWYGAKFLQGYFFTKQLRR